MGVCTTRTPSAKDFVERATELGVAIVDEKANLAKATLDRQVARLSVPTPSAAGWKRGQVHPPCGQLHEEQHIDRPQPSGLHGEEVAGQDAAGLAGQKLRP